MLFIKDREGNLWNVAWIEGFFKDGDYYVGYVMGSQDDAEDRPRFDNEEVERVWTASMKAWRHE